MKNIFYLLLFCVSSIQAQYSCSHSEQRESLYNTYPELRPAENSRHAYLEEFTRQYREISGIRSIETMVIPLVFHVVHDNGEENISDAQIFESIVQLNEDYAALNPELVDVHPNFSDLVADVGVEFRLAELDPNGEPTTGINRIQSDLTYNGSNIALKEMIQWDPTMYLNIWVVHSSDGGNGSAFAYYPADVEGSGSIYDGVVSSYWAVGRTETAVWTHYKILTHEVGHWANLKHTWGDESNNQSSDGCSYDDEVEDTPNTIGNADCDLEAESCGSLDNVQNYMDYSNCPNMFTEGQKTRMLAALNSDVGGRNNLWSEENHNRVFIQEDYLPRIVYNAESFTESYSNDGSINSSVEIELIDLAFAANGALTEELDFTSNNLPAGTSISVEVIDTTHAQIYMTGTVSNHLEADALDNIELHFTASPFAEVSYDDIYNPSKTNIGLTFMDPYEIVFVDLIDDVHNFFEGQQWKWFTMGSGGADFGLFHYDLINIKLETYGNGAICNTGTSNITPLEIGVEVGPDSEITYPGEWYPDQLDLSNPNYTEWNGQTAYAGVQFQKNGNNHYGWIRIKVSEDGKHYYALDMAYNEAPEMSIITGQVQEPVIAYSQTVFHESEANDGSIESQRVIDVFGATWSDFMSVSDGDGFTLSNVPTGLSAQLDKVSDTQVNLSFIGNADANGNIDDYNYMDLAFDESLINGAGAEMSLTQSLSVDFADHYAIEYENISASENISIANPGNEWKWFTLGVGDAEYGLWYVNEYFRFETYSKSAVCNAGTKDLAVLQPGALIGDESYWDYFTELETQLVITSPDYTEWNGQTAYVGIKFTIAERFHYGWMQFQVSDTGDEVVLIDYAYNTKPGEEIAAGQMFATYGCMDTLALNFNPYAIEDDGTCEFPLDCGTDVYMSLTTYDSYGDGWNNNYLTFLNSFGGEVESFTMNSGAEASYEFCLAPDCYQYSGGGGGSWTSEISWEVYMDYELLVEGVGDDSGLFSVGADCNAYIGCTDELAFNYNPVAIEEDGSCTYPIMGCTSIEALNYNSEAEEEDGSCYYDYDVLGCNDPFALNFNSSATYSDGSCEYPSLSLIDVSTELCMDDTILISWIGGSPNGLISISLINVTTNTTAFQIDITDNTGTYFWLAEVVWSDIEDTYRFYIQDYPWPPNSWSYGNEFMFNSICTQLGSQTILFEQGWSMISTYIIPENTDFTVFIAPVVANMIIAKDNLGAAYLPEWNFNGIGDLLQGQGYQVKMSSSDVLVVEGVQIQPEENPIDLNEGWNMIAYLRTEAASADLVFANLVEAGNVVIVKDYTGNAFLPEWSFNGIGDMLPGKGYQLKVNNSDELLYQSNEE